jgi:SAM-dependent methyltransferase
VRLINPQIAKDLRNGTPIRIDLGSGAHPRPGCYSLDLHEAEGIDIVADLNQPLDLFPDDCAEYVFSSHALEHVERLVPLIREIHRITRPDGLIEIVVPHFSNPYAYSDPTHVRFFGLYSMNYFVDTEKQPSVWRVPPLREAPRFEIESVQIAFYRVGLLDRLLVPALRYLVNRTASAQNFYELRLSRFLPAAELRYRLRACKPAR